MKVKSTTYAIDDVEHINPIIVEEEMSPRDAIREFVQCQAMHIFGMPQAEHILNLIVNGFFLFNLRKDKYMLNSKDDLLKYCKDNSVPFEEKMYFDDIFLYNQRPEFLTRDEHEYIRAMGDLDDYTPPTPPPERKPSGFLKPMLISDELAMFLGKPLGTEMTRVDVNKELIAYIKDNDLQDKENSRKINPKINPDEKLSNLLRLKEDDELTYFNLQRYLKHHFIK
jgi:chromatin remodeling complex protein RSC6